MLRDVEGILPHVGKRVEATVYLDEFSGTHGFRELAPGDAGIRRLCRGDVAVVMRCYVHQSFRGISFRDVLLC